MFRTSDDTDCMHHQYYTQVVTKIIIISYILSRNKVYFTHFKKSFYNYQIKWLTLMQFLIKLYQ